MDNNLHNLSVSELSGLLENKEISSLELTKEFLNKIKITEPSVNAFALITREKAFEQASESDEKRKLNKKNSSVLLTGGGTFNKYLVKRIKINNKVKSIFVVPEKKLINFKEALIFGFLGLMRLLNKKNVLKSVTGSKKSTSSGVIINNKFF